MGLLGLTSLAAGSTTLLNGCRTAGVPPRPKLQEADPSRTRAAVSFQAQNSPDMSGFTKHWSLGSQTAWFNASKGEVLVLGPGKTEALRISGFPEEYGGIVATGWEGGKRFFVHVSKGPDAGTMIYCDLVKTEVTEVKHWAAY